jgi:hypothetical protein
MMKSILFFVLMVVSVSANESQIGSFDKLHRISDQMPAGVQPFNVQSFSSISVDLNSDLIDLSASIPSLQAALKSNILLVLTPKTPENIELRVPYQGSKGLATARVLINVYDIKDTTTSFLLVHKGNGKYDLVPAFGVTDMIRIEKALILSNRFTIFPSVYPSFEEEVEPQE